MKKFKGFLFGIVCLLTLGLGFVFSGCGNNYEGISISLSAEEVNFRIGFGESDVSESEVSATISGVKKDGISKVLEFTSSSSEVVRVESSRYANDVTTAKLVAVGGGDAFIFVLSEGNVARQIAVHVEQEASSISVDVNYTPMMLVGGQGGFVFDINRVIFSPASCSTKDVKVELWKKGVNLEAKVIDDASVITQAQIDDLKIASNVSYYFKVIKTSTIGTGNELVATCPVAVREVLRLGDLSLFNIANNSNVQNVELSTDNLGIDSLKPSLISVGIKYENSVDLSDFEVRVSAESNGTFAVSEIRQGTGGVKYFDITALGSGSGSVKVELLYDGYEVSKIESVLNVSVVEYPRNLVVVANDRQITDGSFNIYGENDNLVSFSAKPLDVNTSAYIRLEIADESFACLKKDDGTTNVISDVQFVKNGNDIWVSNEFISGKIFNFVLNENVDGETLIYLNAYISKAVLSQEGQEPQVIFQNVKISEKALVAKATVAIKDVALVLNDSAISQDAQQPTTVLTTVNDSNNNVLNGVAFNVQINPVNANTESLNFIAENASISYDETNRILTITPNGTNSVVKITVTADKLATKEFFIQFYVNIESVSANLDEIELNGNAIINRTNNIIYLSKNSNDSFALPIVFANSFAANCVDSNCLVSFATNLQAVYENGKVIITCSDLTEIQGRVTITLVNKFNPADEQSFDLNIAMYDKIQYSTVKFFEEGASLNPISQVELDYFGSVGIYGNYYKMFYLGNLDEMTEYSFSIYGSSEVAESGTINGFEYSKKLVSSYGTLYIRGRAALFAANAWKDNGSDFVIVNIVGTEKQFNTTYSTNLEVLIYNRVKTNYISITNVADSLYTRIQIENFQIEQTVSPSNAANKNVVYVVTDESLVVLGTTLDSDLVLENADQEEILSITQSGILSVYVCGSYRIFAIAKDSIFTEINVDEVISVNGMRFDSFGLVYADGSMENPYLISSVDELVLLSENGYFANLTANAGEGYYFVLTNDINCNGRALSLGKLHGKLNGNDKKIFNFSVKESASNSCGLFSEIEGAVKNLTVCNAEFIFESDYEYAGVLAGRITGSINNIKVYNIGVTFQGTVGNFGGVAGSAWLDGEAYVEVSNLRFTGFASNMGGVFGYLESKSGAYAAVKGRYFGELAPVYYVSDNASSTVNVTVEFLLDENDNNYYLVDNSFGGEKGDLVSVVNSKDLLYTDGIKFDYFDLEGNSWVTLSKVSGNNYTWTNGEVTYYFVINKANSIYYKTDASYNTSGALAKALTLVDSKINIFDDGTNKKFVCENSLAWNDIDENLVCACELISLTNNIAIYNGYANVSVSIQKTDNVELQHEKFVYFLDENDLISGLKLDSIFTVSSTATDANDYSIVFRNLGYTVSTSGDVFNFDAVSQTYKINKYGECTFTATSDIDGNVKATITIYFLPKNVALESENIEITSNQQVTVEIETNLQGDLVTSSFGFELANFAGNVKKVDGTNDIIEFADTTLAQGGSFDVVYYYYFGNNVKIELARKTVTVTMNTLATKVEANISKNSITVTDTAILNVMVHAIDENNANFTGLEDVNGIKFAEITAPTYADGVKTYTYRVYASDGATYGTTTFNIKAVSGSANTNLSVTIVRSIVADVAINHFENDGSSSETEAEQSVLSGKAINNETISIDDSSILAFYLTPEIADVTSVTLTSNYVGFVWINSNGEVQPSSDIEPISGGIKIKTNPFNNGWLYTTATTANSIEAGREIWVEVSVTYKISDNESRTFTKRQTFIADHKSTFQIVAPTKAVSLCEFNISFKVDGQVVSGQKLLEIRDSLVLNSNFQIVGTNELAGTVTLMPTANVFGLAQIKAYYDQTIVGITKNYEAVAQIEVVDAIIEGIEFVSNFGKDTESSIDGSLIVTAYNYFNVGFRFVGTWNSGFDKKIKKLESELNSNKIYRNYLFRALDKNGDYQTIIEGNEYSYLKFESSNENAAGESKLMIFPTRPTSSTGLGLVLQVAYENGKILVRISDGLSSNFIGLDLQISDYYGSNVTEIDSTLSVMVNANSSDDCPLPITSLSELIANNQAGARLILLNDIEIDEISPIVTQFEYLDGNGYSLILSENAFQNYLANIEEGKDGYIKEGTLNVGVFSVVSENSTIKNLNVAVKANNTATGYSTKASALNLSFNYVATSATALVINFGALAATNNGIIVNCHVIYLDTPQIEAASTTDDILYKANITRFADNQSITGNIATFVGVNKGTITNSSTCVDIAVGTDSSPTTGDYNVAGFVANNQGFISASNASAMSVYGKNENNENDGSKVTLSGNESAYSLVAGFVAYNSGVITDSYIFGENDITKWNQNSTLKDFIVADYKFVQANGAASAFAMVNEGRIINSYANIYVKSNTKVGFVYQNTSQGIIQNVYALSLVTDIPDPDATDTNAYAFIVENFGTLSNCYCLKDSRVTPIPFDGLKYLESNEVTQKQSYVGFGFPTEYNKNDADWTFETNEIYVYDPNGVDTIYLINVGVDGSYSVKEIDGNFTFYYTGKGKGNYNITTKNSEGVSQFTATKTSIALPRIVSADTIISSRRVFTGGVDEKGNYYEQSVIESSGIVVKYNYYTYLTEEDGFAGYYDIGTKNNPILISTLYEFKTLLINGAPTYAKYGNDYYYKLLRELDFNKEKTAPAITTSTFYGFLDGSGMTINNFTINVGKGSDFDGSTSSNEVNEALGLFGIIDGTAGVKMNGISELTLAGAGVKGLTINIKELYANTYVYVGGLAGVVNNGYIYNVSVNQVSAAGETLISYGRNIIGGVIGIVKGESDIYSLTSNVSVFSTYSSKQTPWSEGTSGDFQTFRTKSQTYSSTNFIQGFSYNSDKETSYVGGVIGILDAKNTLSSNAIVSQTLIARPSEMFLVKGSRVGGIVGYVGEGVSLLDARLDLANVSSVSISGSDITGGLVGENKGTVESATIINQKQKEVDSTTKTTEVSTMFNSSTGKILGGVVGVNYGTLKNSWAFNTNDINSSLKLTVKNSNAAYFGGVVGVNIGGNIEGCSNALNLEVSTRNVFVGGIIGYNKATTGKNSSSITSCFNLGSITATNAYSEMSGASLGGLVGKSNINLEIAKCFNVGTLSTNYIGFVMGGIIGTSEEDVAITDTFVACEVNNNFKPTMSSIIEDYERLSSGVIGYVNINQNTSVTINNGYEACRYFDSNGTGSFYVVANIDSEQPELEESMNVSNFYTVKPYLTDNITTFATNAEVKTISDETFLELNRTLALNSKEDTWKTDGGWAPVNNFSDIAKFRNAISISGSPLAISTIQVTSSTTQFTGNNIYVLTDNITLANEIDASGWSGTLIGNGFTITLKDGHSLFKNNKLGSGATLFNFNIALEYGATSKFTKEGNYGTIISSIEDVSSLNIFDVHSLYNETTQLVAGRTTATNESSFSASIGGFIGSATRSTVTFRGCINSIDIQKGEVKAKQDQTIEEGSVVIAGFVGTALNSTLNFSSCLNAGKLTDNNQTANVAGFVGSVSNANVIIDQSISSGEITANEELMDAFVQGGEYSDVGDRYISTNGTSYFYVVDKEQYLLEPNTNYDGNCYYVYTDGNNTYYYYINPSASTNKYYKATDETYSTTGKTNLTRITNKNQEEYSTYLIKVGTNYYYFDGKSANLLTKVETSVYTPVLDIAFGFGNPFDNTKYSSKLTFSNNKFHNESGNYNWDYITLTYSDFTSGRVLDYTSTYGYSITLSKIANAQNNYMVYVGDVAYLLENNFDENNLYFLVGDYGSSSYKHFYFVPTTPLTTTSYNYTDNSGTVHTFDPENNKKDGNKTCYTLGKANLNLVYNDNGTWQVTTTQGSGSNSRLVWKNLTLNPNKIYYYYCTDKENNLHYLKVDRGVGEYFVTSDSTYQTDTENLKFVANSSLKTISNSIIAAANLPAITAGGPHDCYQLGEDVSLIYFDEEGDRYTVQKGTGDPGDPITWAYLSRVLTAEDYSPWTEAKYVKIPIVMFSNLDELADVANSDYLSSLRPQLVSTEEQLKNVSGNKLYVLENDIVLSSPINSEFSGFIIGNGCTITLSGADNNYLFANGKLGAATIQDLTIVGGGLTENYLDSETLNVLNVKITRTTVPMIGRVTGAGATVNVEGCFVEGTISGDNVGGFIGTVTAVGSSTTSVKFDSCVAVATITATDHGAGFVGYASGQNLAFTITNSVSAGKLIIAPANNQAQSVSDFCFVGSNNITFVFENSYAASMVESRVESGGYYYTLAHAYNTNGIIQDNNIWSLYANFTKPLSLGQFSETVENDLELVVFSDLITALQNVPNEKWNTQFAFPFPTEAFESYAEFEEFAKTAQTFLMQYIPIQTEDELLNIGNEELGYSKNGFYFIMDDIALTEPITNTFSGTISGNDHKIVLNGTDFMFAANTISSDANTSVNITSLTISGGGLTPSISNANVKISNVAVLSGSAVQEKYLIREVNSSNIMLSNVSLSNPEIYVPAQNSQTSGGLFNHGGYFERVDGNLSSTTSRYSVTNYATVSLVNDQLVYNYNIPHYAFLNSHALTSIAVNNDCAVFGRIENCKNLTNVILGSGVIEIGAQSFQNCDSLENISIDSNNEYYKVQGNCVITKKGVYAYSAADTSIDSSLKNSNLSQGQRFAANTLIFGFKNSIIPNGVEYIAEYAFYNCTGLESITIPSSVKEIHYKAFAGCTSLAQITFNQPTNGLKLDGSSYYKVDGNQLVVKTDDSDLGWAFSGCSALGAVSLPNGTSVVGYSCFRDSSISSITVPDSVSTIKGAAFYNCYNLSSVALPSGLTEISSLLFSSENTAKANRLTSVTIPASVTQISEGAFKNASNLQTVTIPSGSQLTTIGKEAFQSCWALTSISLANATNLTSIGKSAFANAQNLSSVTIPASVTTVGDSAFLGCTSLNSVTFAGTPSIQKISNSMFEGCSNLEIITIPASVTEIEEGAFASCYRLSSVTFASGSSIGIIGSYAFGDCSALTSFTIPSNVKQIGDSAFADCGSLTQVVFEDVYGWKAGETSLSSQSLSDSALAASYLTVTAYRFADWTHSLPEWMSFTLIDDGTSYKVSYGGGDRSEVVGKIRIPATYAVNGGTSKPVTEIEGFNDCVNMTGITIPSSVTKIKSNAFKNCTGLTGTLEIPDSVTFIGALSFYGCSGLTGLKLGSSMTNSNLTTIRGQAFYGCTGLTGALQIPNRVTEIYGLAFSSCAHLTSLVLGSSASSSSLTKIYSYAFSLCTRLTGALQIPDKVTEIGDYAFERCAGLSSVKFGATAFGVYHCSLTKIGVHAFYGCSNLSGALQIPSQIKSIGDYAFYSCSKLSSVSFVQNYAYNNGHWTWWGGTNATIGDYTFAYCRGLTGTLQISSEVKSIGAYAFYNCSSLTGITIGSGVATVGNDAFSGCSSLNQVYILGQAFYDLLQDNSTGARSVFQSNNFPHYLYIKTTVNARAAVILYLVSGLGFSDNGTSDGYNVWQR